MLFTTEFFCLVGGDRYYIILLLPLTLACVTGGNYDAGEGIDIGSEDILEYRDGEGWRKVGAMKNVRSAHAVSLVKYEDFKDSCN